MKVYVAFPAGNTQRANETLMDYHRLGYFSAVLIDAGMEPPSANRVLVANPYPGFPTAANDLCHACVEDGADWVLLGGDDIQPVPTMLAEQIAAECTAHFGGTLGVVQPAGDKYGALTPGYAYPSCVSPWIGREFIQRAYGGHGPYHTGYKHLCADTSLRFVAHKLGLLWWRDDLTQYHAHWSRGVTDTLPKDKRERIKAAFPADLALFKARRDAGFPGHELLLPAAHG